MRMNLDRDGHSGRTCKYFSPEAPLSLIRIHNLPKRVIFVSTDYPQRGGRTTFTLNLAHGFRELSCKVRVISLWGTGEDEARWIHTTRLFPSERWLLQPVPRGARSLPSIAFLVRVFTKRLLKIRATLVMFWVRQTSRTSTLIINEGPIESEYVADHGIVAKGSAPVVFGQYHSAFSTAAQYFPGRNLHELARAYDRTDRFVALTPEDAKQFSSFVSTPCASIPNPASPTRRHLATKDAELADTSEKGAVATVARLAEEKRVDLMVEMFAKATSSRELRHWKLDIYGDGPEREALEALISRMGVPEHVRMKGWTQDPIAALSGSSLFLLTSSFEGWPASICEAAQAGVSALAFACSPGVVDLVTSLGGEVVEMDNVASYVRRLHDLLGDPEELRRRGAAAADAAARYAPTTIAQEWVRLYDTALKSRVARIAH